MTALSYCNKSFEKLEIFPKLLDEINPNIKFSKDTSEKITIPRYFSEEMKYKDYY